MSRQLISKMATKQSTIQRQVAAAAMRAQRGSRQRPFSCLATVMSSDNNSISRPTNNNTIFSSSRMTIRQQQQPSQLSTHWTTASRSSQFSLQYQSIRWFSEEGDDIKSQKEKKKEMKQKAKEAAAAKAAEEDKAKEEDSPAEANDAKKEEDSTPPPAETTKAEEPPEEKKEDDDVPDWQNPLHHNNPDMQKIFEEDYGPGEEMPIAEAPPLEDPENPEKVLASQELYDLADEIVNLSMLEMTELVNKIGDHFEFDKPPFVGSDGSGGGDEAEDEGGDGEVVEAAAAKTAFDIKLVGFDDKAKIKVIKEVRALAGLGLKEAKEMVEGAPGIVMKDIGKDQADELKAKLEAAGATVEIV